MEALGGLGPLETVGLWGGFRGTQKTLACIVVSL